METYLATTNISMSVLDRSSEVTSDRSENWPPKLDIFGIGVSPTTYIDATQVILDVAKEKRNGLVSCYAVHALMTFCGDDSLREVSNAFDMVTPDGQPVRWALNLLHGTKLKDRVYGPQLMLHLCERAAYENIPIYLYGGSPETVESLQKNLIEKFPSLPIAGFESPPFRQLTPEEDEAVVERINGSGAGLVFIGLGCPKQDLFAYEHRERIQGVQICVGAAFDFHAGTKSSPPEWMQKRGLEWLYRLIQEPKRLWRRYFETNSRYLACLAGWLLNLPKVRRQRAAWRAQTAGQCKLAGSSTGPTEQP